MRLRIHSENVQPVGEIVQFFQRALHWYRQAAMQGQTVAAYNLGFSYDVGVGIPEDDFEAERWYRRAAEQGMAEAQFALGNLYATGARRDPIEAYRWILIASEAGYPGALRALQGLEREMSIRDVDDARRLAQDWLARRRGGGEASP